MPFSPLLLCYFLYSCTHVIYFNKTPVKAAEDTTDDSQKDDQEENKNDDIIVIPNNEIWYTSTDGKIVTPPTYADFGAEIVSNTYENSKGIITFDGEVTEIGGSAFRYCKSLISITIPDSVTAIDVNPFGSCNNLAEFKGKFAADNGRCLSVDGVLNSFAPVSE